MNKLNEVQYEYRQERFVELYSQLCNWHWFETNPDETLVEVSHTSDESRKFANKVFEFMNKELENNGTTD
jgi:hypothetical protein